MFSQTKITLETFLAWKKRKLKEKKEQALKDEEKRRNDYKAGRQVGISGREMFYFNPELAAGDGIFFYYFTLCNLCYYYKYTIYSENNFRY